TIEVQWHREQGANEHGIVCLGRCFCHGLVQAVYVRTLGCSGLAFAGKGDSDMEVLGGLAVAFGLGFVARAVCFYATKAPLEPVEQRWKDPAILETYSIGWKVLDDAGLKRGEFHAFVAPATVEREYRD